jgi:hypothetical protein
MAPARYTLMDEYCRHIVHENGIHELILLSGTKQGVDCYMEKIGALFLSMPREKTLRYILNGTEAPLPPIQYFVNESNRFEREHKYIGNGRLAILYRKDPFWSVASRVVTMLNVFYHGRLKLQIFEGKERKTAIEWLLRDD